MKKLNYTFYILSIILILLYGIFVFTTNKGLACPMFKYFHIYCPACGITRMFKSLFCFDFYQAFRFNPFIFILLIILFLIITVEIFWLFNKKEFIKIDSRVYLVLIIFLFIYTILRNIEMFSFLLPTIVN